MSQFSLVLILLGAALMHAVWNAVVKFDGNKLYILSMIDGMAMLVGLVLLPFASFPEAQVWPYLAISVVLNILYRIFLIKAYELGEFSRVYPLVRGLPPLAVTLLAVFFLGEEVSVLNLLGIGFISLGIISVMAVKFGGHRRTIIFSLFSGLCIALYTLADGMGIRESKDLFSYIIWFTVLENMPFPLYTTLFHRPEFKSFLKASYRRGLIGGFNAAAGYGIVLWAMTFANLGSVSALRESCILFATLIGIFFFKEGLGIQKIIASTAIVSGIFLIQFSL
ncbi:EamA family transporter [Kiloniella sp.]|uniref:EamA family transporter n=1 Tax=Kiloniella sp. TaxID=1938587 RepID=UPI003B02C9A7